MERNDLKTFELTVDGLVQGVGYRPFAAGLLRSLDMCGTVRNNGGRVKICVTAANEAVEELIHRLYKYYPEGAAVERVSLRELPFKEFNGVVVEESDADGEIPVLPADICICEGCIKEIKESANRRFRYPFISCASCGPRYTIMRRIPYDRENTTMQSFEMCDECKREYFTFGNRRYYAQTQSCKRCGPQLFLKIPPKEELSVKTAPEKSASEDLPEKNRENTVILKREDAEKRAFELIAGGEVIAVKNTGGYHLVCDASSENAVEKIRKLKKRDKKPFAVMFPDSESVRKHAQLSEAEKELLESPARPVVILMAKGFGDSGADKGDSEYDASDKSGLFKGRGKIAEGVMLESPFLGAMLPSNGLQVLLSERFPLLVMTSANLSGEPMITDDCEIECFGIPVLGNDREILTPADDSVARIIDGRTQILRRGRGYVPLPVDVSFDMGEKAVFAAGADMKSAFAYGKGNRIFFSQYLGDLSRKRVRSEYFKVKKRMEDCFNLKAERIIADRHPLYFSRRAAEASASDTLPIEYVNHHFAHMASVMAEHGINGDAIGFAFDGTGYGEDGTVWGGEVLFFGKGGFERIGSLMPVKMTGGDEGALNAELSLAAYLHELQKRNNSCFAEAEKFRSDKAMETVFKALDRGINTVTQSSAGRLFDAAAALLGICSRNGYEGQCPCELEYAAWKAAGPKGSLKIRSIIKEGRILADTPDLICQLLKLSDKEEKSVLAYDFHLALARWLGECAEFAAGIRQNRNLPVILSGGTFANRLLTVLCISELSARGFKVFISEKLPPGDDGIALGQLFISNKERESEKCV